MKTENKYIKIVEDENTIGERKTKTFDIVNKNGEYYIGQIYWYGAWRQYCFFPYEDMVFNSTCLELIIAFLNDINEKHRTNWKQKNTD